MRRPYVEEIRLLGTARFEHFAVEYTASGRCAWEHVDHNISFGQRLGQVRGHYIYTRNGKKKT